MNSLSETTNASYAETRAASFTQHYTVVHSRHRPPPALTHRQKPCSTSTSNLAGSAAVHPPPPAAPRPYFRHHGRRPLGWARGGPRRGTGWGSDRVGRRPEAQPAVGGPHHDVHALLLVALGRQLALPEGGLPGLLHRQLTHPERCSAGKLHFGDRTVRCVGIGGQWCRMGQRGLVTNPPFGRPSNPNHTSPKGEHIRVLLSCLPRGRFAWVCRQVERVK